MKIVNKQKFYELPEGTLFSDYEPFCISELKIKGENIVDRYNTPFDFYYTDLIGNVKYSDTEEFMDILSESEEKGTSIELDFNSTERDALYNQEELYAVYEEEDLNNLIEKLQSIKNRKND